MSFDEPPKEFRIFKSGWNDTYKGKFLFDELAAASVMAEYEEHGVDRPIDLEHFSIPDEDKQVKDPDARGWFNLEVKDGELWAVNVHWNTDGERRLRNKTQRYISPFFGFDKKTRRVQSLYNVAICAIPATKDMPALVAASARKNLGLAALSIGANDMDLKKILSALGLEDDSTVEDALGAIKAFQEEDGKGDEKMGKLRKMLKLADDASDDDVEAALKKLNIGGGDEDSGDQDPKREVKEVKSSDDLNEDEKELASMSPKLRGKFMALSSNVAKLSKQVATLVVKQTKSEVEQLISDNTDKVPLHMEPFLKSQPLEVVQEFLKHSIATQRPSEQPKKKTGSAALTLTPEEKEIAKLSGFTEDQALEYKKVRVATDNKRAGSQA